MLVLTRRTGEIIRIGDEISFQVLGIKGNQVRFVIIAPKDIKVHRDEIYQKIKQERAGYCYSKNYFHDDLKNFDYSQESNITH